MKKIVVVVLSILTFILSGCFDKNAFDFSRLSNIEAEGTWGLPLMNAKYTIGDILALADNQDVLQIGNDGTLEIHYVYEKDSVISANEYLDTFSSQTFSVSGSTTVPIGQLPPPIESIQMLYNDTLEVVLPSDVVIINSADLKTGLVTLEITYNVNEPIHVKASCPQIRNASGQPFVIDETSTGGHFNKTFDLSGFKLVVPTVNTLEFYLEASCLVNAQFPSVLSFNYGLSLTQIRFSEVVGSFTPVSLSFDEVFDFDLSFLQNRLSGSLTLINPQVKCEIMNTFPIDGVITLDQADVYGPGVNTTLLNSSPATIEVPASTPQFKEVDLPLASSIMLSSHFEHFKLSGNAVLNTGGLQHQMVFRDDQLIHLRLSLVLPLQLTIDNIVYTDTLALGQIDIPDEPAFSNLFLRLGIRNGIPLNFGLQAYFFDSGLGVIKDSLFINPQIILSAQGDVPRESALYASREDLKAVQELLSCDKVIIKAKVYTDKNNGPVSIRADQTLGVLLSAKFNMDVNVLVNNEP